MNEFADMFRHESRFQRSLSSRHKRVMKASLHRSLEGTETSHARLQYVATRAQRRLQCCMTHTWSKALKRTKLHDNFEKNTEISRLLVAAKDFKQDKTGLRRYGCQPIATMPYSGLGNSLAPRSRKICRDTGIRKMLSL